MIAQGEPRWGRAGGVLRRRPMNRAVTQSRSAWALGVPNKSLIDDLSPRADNPEL